MGQMKGQFRDNVPTKNKCNTNVENSKVVNQYVDSNRLLNIDKINIENNNNRISNKNIQGLLATNKPRKLLLKYFNKSEVDYTLKIIDYYFGNYLRVMNKRHPIIKVMNLYRIAIIINDGYFDCNLVENTYYSDIDLNTWFYMIDKHFKTEYESFDYNINHFFCDGILANRYLEVRNYC